MSDADFDVVIIGGGVVGLSIGYHCAESGLSTVIVERHQEFCEEASSHNSGVIHSGFQPAPGTLKAKLNVEGARLLYEMSEKWRFRTAKVGTLVVALNDEQRERLKILKANAEENGVVGVKLLSAEMSREFEPHLRGVVGALYSPEDGVVDLSEYAASLKAHASLAGAVLAPGRALEKMKGGKNRIDLTLSKDESLSCRFLVNSAGVNADVVAAMLGSSYTIYPCVGEYAFITGQSEGLVNGMVYPVPRAGSPGLGIHLTRTIDGMLQAGPTAVYPEKREPLLWRKTTISEFASAVGRFLPGIDPGSFRSGWYGVRAKTVPPGSGRGYDDFTIEWDANGFPAIHLLGIESPGLTSSLSIGTHVASMITERFRAST